MGHPIDLYFCLYAFSLKLLFVRRLRVIDVKISTEENKRDGGAEKRRHPSSIRGVIQPSWNVSRNFREPAER